MLTKRSTRMLTWFKWLEMAVFRIGPVTPLAMVSFLIGHSLKGAADAGLKARSIEFSMSPSWPLPNLHLGVSVEAAKYKYRLDNLRGCPAKVRFCSLEPLLDDLGVVNFEGIDQAIVGAESGRGARPMFEDWARGVRDQAVAQNCAFFLKQYVFKGRKVSLPLLDGKQWTQMPGQAGPQ